MISFTVLPKVSLRRNALNNQHGIDDLGRRSRFRGQELEPADNDAGHFAEI